MRFKTTADMWRVEAIHPHKIDPFDTYINHFSTSEKADACKAELERQGYEHITITPPPGERRRLAGEKPMY